jgi:copper chaperone CopZ
MNRAELSIQGMSCGHCVAQVRQTLASLPGVAAESVEIGRAIVSYEPGAVDVARIEAELTRKGYPAVRL